MAVYVGGPCDGQAAPASGIYARVSCGGVDYTLHEDGNYYSAAATGGGVGVQVLGTHAPKGWHDLQVSVNRRLPTSLQHARRVTRATLRTLSRKRRVR